MVLAAADELRHEANDDFFWRESLYFNFADVDNEIGAWLYLWVVPNQEMKSGMLVSFYHGITDRMDANDVAMDSPNHFYEGAYGSWVYCYKRNLAELLSTNFDDVELCGYQLTRKEPLQLYRLTFADDSGSGFEFDGTFTMPPYDYADGAYPTPTWVAANRYHRSWLVKGRLTVGGSTYQIDTTGDSDHSWGQRNHTEFAKRTFKMWSFQTKDGSRSVSVIEQGEGLYLGFINSGGEQLSVSNIEHSSRYTSSGVQQNVGLVITDTGGRVVRARMDKMFAAIGNGRPGETTWGFEGVGLYEVDEWGPCSGITSYFWPPAITPSSLHEAQA